MERQGKHPFLGRELVKAVVECAAKIASIETLDLIRYIQRGVWFGGPGIDN